MSKKRSAETYDPGSAELVQCLGESEALFEQAVDIGNVSKDVCVNGAEVVYSTCQIGSVEQICATDLATSQASCRQTLDDGVLAGRVEYDDCYSACGGDVGCESLCAQGFGGDLEIAASSASPCLQNAVSGHTSCLMFPACPNTFF